MVYFRDLFWCCLQHRLNRSLRELDQFDVAVPPMPYRVNPFSYDFAQHSRWPKPLGRIRGEIIDLIRLSLDGFAPAMVELSKLSARDDVIRLTPRFNYFLLEGARRAGRLDDANARLLRLVTPHLTAADRAEVNARVELRKWPLDEPMVID